MTDASIELRRAAPRDLDALVDLAAATFPLACPPSTTPAAIAEHVRTKLSAEVIRGWIDRDDCTVLVADGAVGLCAYALVVTGPCGDALAAEALNAVGIDTARIHELSKIYALPGVQGGGLAVRLLEATIDAAVAKHGPLPVWLGTNDENARAQAFYRRCGFEVVGSRTFTVGGRDESDVVMLQR
ncbi:GNAT family N-acetyltransferase [Demequina sp. NBRC 110056]|uniref:GNAT family N-acetyltransferase n=1 Tax=Demequina sp. NBRC 110056 TaxID=1570345 RepID=UPI0013566B1B|nr:N-acetyltransferase [Demequina sp. NBRC 110056]